MAEGYFNPFSKFFLRGKPGIEKEREKQINKNTQGINDQDAYYKYLYGQQNNDSISDGFANVYIAPIHFDQYFQHKRIRILKYREMAWYPEINDALDMVTDEAIVEDEHGQIISLNIKREVTKLEQRQIKEQWDYVINDLINVQDNLWDMFRKWLVEAELYVELVLNDKKDCVIAVRTLPSFITYPVFDGASIAYFIQKTQMESYNAGYQQNGSPDDKQAKHQIVFPREQVAYANYGGYPGTSRADVRGYLEPAIRIYNMLRALEDSVVVYRLTRAPERRVWNIEVGRMPTGKVEEYIKKLIHKYRRQLNYNPNTGAVDASQNVQALSEDFWFAKRDGNGTSVDTLPSGSNLGELGDLDFFNDKLLTVLKIPKQRFGAGGGGSTSTYQSGSTIERDEIKFWNFVQRLQKRFKKVIMDIFIQQLSLQGFDPKLCDRKLYDIKFTEANYYKEFKELALLETKLNVFSSLSTFIITDENPDGEFSWEFVAKQMMNMNDDEYDMNEELKEKERKALKDKIKFKAELENLKVKLEPKEDESGPDSTNSATEA
jgi:hypothetical protein